jgi:hypothetical protein
MVTSAVQLKHPFIATRSFYQDRLGANIGSLNVVMLGTFGFDLYIAITTGFVSLLTAGLPKA